MRHTGNDIVDLIKVYKEEIIKSRPSVPSDFEKYMVELCLSTLPLCLFPKLIGSFLNKDIAKKVLSEFLKDFNYLILNDDSVDISFQMVKDLDMQIFTRGINAYPAFYFRALEITSTPEEAIFIRNFTSAINKIFEEYKSYAVAMKFI